MKQPTPDTLRHVEACKGGHNAASPYFPSAEADMEWQWNKAVWPAIEHADFTDVLEIACGHGRNSVRLARLARRLTLVDINEHCVRACEIRLGDRVERPGGAGVCEVRYIVTDGLSLPGVPDASVSLVYSWDSAVHFAAEVVGRYVSESARVMKPGATGFIHHSNLAAMQPDCSEDFRENDHWRAKMSAAMFRAQCAEVGLEVTGQKVFDWGEAVGSDCVSVFRRPMSV